MRRTWDKYYSAFLTVKSRALYQLAVKKSNDCKRAFPFRQYRTQFAMRAIPTVFWHVEAGWMHLTMRNRADIGHRSSVSSR